jgi:hypothetical protein
MQSQMLPVCLGSALRIAQSVGLLPVVTYEQLPESSHGLSAQQVVQVDAVAKRFAIRDYFLIRDSGNLIVALNRFGPLIWSVPVFNHKTTEFWKRPSPSAEPQGIDELLIVGYDSDAKDVLVRATLGVEWGDFGHWRVPISELFAPHRFVTMVVMELPTFKSQVVSPRKVTLDSDLQSSPQEELIRKLRGKVVKLKRSLLQERRSGGR